MAHAEICPVCKGSGRIGSERYERKDCHGCDGDGWVEVGDTYLTTKKIKIDFGKPEKILGIDIIYVDGVYWASAETIYLLHDMVTGPDYLSTPKEKAEVLFYNGIPIVYKPALD